MPDRDEAQVRLLEELCFNAWPTLRTVLLDGWVVRLADGHSRRANSASQLYPSRLPTDDLIRQVEALFAAARLRTIVRLTPLADPSIEPRLRALGLVEDEPSLTMAAKAIRGHRSDAGITIQAAADAAWLAPAMQAYGHGPVGERALARMFANLLLPAGFATLRDDGHPVAWGLGVVERGYVGLYDLVVAPDRRGAGFGRRLVAALLDWGVRHGARRAYLQVSAANDPARALYRSFGFAEAYAYTHFVSDRPPP